MLRLKSTYVMHFLVEGISFRFNTTLNICLLPSNFDVLLYDNEQAVVHQILAL